MRGVDGCAGLPTNMQSTRSEHTLSEADAVVGDRGKEILVISKEASVLTKLSMHSSSDAMVKHVGPSGVALCEEQTIMCDVCVAHWLWLNKEESV
jgi:hypothetical protein